MLADFKPLLKNKNFVALWTSQLLSQLTIHVMNFLLLIVLFNKTQSAIATSLLWVAYALPAIFIGPFAASFVDMSDRRKLLMYSNLAQAVAIFAFAYTQSFSIFVLYGVALLYSALNQFYVPAEFAALPSLVKKTDYPLANGLFFLTQQGAMIAGFTVAGILNRYIGFEYTLFLCSLFLLIAFFSVKRLPTLNPAKKVPEKFDEAVLQFFSQISEGYRYLRSKPNVYIPFLTLMALQVSTAMVVVNAPNLARDILKISIDLAGIFVAVPAGIGALVGSIAVSRALKTGWSKRASIRMALGLFSVAFLYISVISFHLPYILNLGLSIVMLVITGAGFVAVFIPLQTHIQETTPGGLRGRVFGNFWFLVTIATIFPVIASGAITEIIGVRVFYFLLTVLSALGYLSIEKYKKAFSH